MLSSTIIFILKDKTTSLSISDNYREISLINETYIYLQNV